MSGREEYIRARKIGQRQVEEAESEGRNPYLHALETVLPEYTKLSRIPLGRREIPLDMIAGTLTAGRQNAFSWDFMPILDMKSEFGLKWVNLYESQEREGIREPVVVFEYMNRFYVQEGNKRVSVMKYCGGVGIPAEITRLMPARKDTPERRIYDEFLEFYNVTGLFEITFSAEGGYERLAEIYGCTLTDKWSEQALLDIKSDFGQFQTALYDLGGKKLSLTAGDAFLLYLTVYGKECFCEDGRKDTARRIKNLWSEFQAEGNEEGAALILDPETRKKTQSLLEKIGIFSQEKYTAEHPLKAAFIYQKNPGISSWTYGHELGRNELAQNFDGLVETFCYEDRADDESIDSAFADAVRRGADVIFTTSPMHMEASQRAAILYPTVRILNCSINLTSSAVRTYYSRMYEARFLMGALAASLSEDHRIAYVADYPIYGTIAGINAFALGCSLVDPSAVVSLFWSGKKENRWEQEVKNSGIRIVSGPDMIKPRDASRKYGLFMTSGNGIVRNLAAPIWDWGHFYTLIVSSILNGTYDDRNRIGQDQAVNYWYGMSAGVIDLIFSKELSYRTRNLMKMLRDTVISGTSDLFSMEMVSQDGTVRCSGETSLSMPEIITMSWLLDNVEGTIPGPDEMDDTAAGTVSVSGVAAGGADR